MSKQEDKIISTNEMRKLLGKEYADISDSEVNAIIVQVELMAEITIKRIKKDLTIPKST